MTRNTNAIDPSKLRRPVVPVLLTLLAGLGGGIFAMKPEVVPSEPQVDNFKAPANSAMSADESAPVAMVEPSFAPKAELAEPDPILASVPVHSTGPVHSAPSVPSARPAQMQAAFKVESGPAAASPPVAAKLAMEPAPVEQPPVTTAPSAPPIAPAIAIAQAPVAQAPVAQPLVTQPDSEPAGDTSVASTPVLPTAAQAENVVALQAEKPAAAPAAAPTAAPEAAPVPQLALADWNYSLPEQVPASDRNAFAAETGNAPITLVPSRATPVHATQGSAARSAGARAKLAAPTGKVPTAIGNRKIAGSGFASAVDSKGKYQFVGSEIEFQLPVVANGAPVGDLTLHVAPNQQVSLRLRELLSLFHEQIDPQVLTTLVASPSIESFVTFDKLRDAGIEIRYDAARDRLDLSVEQP